MKSADTPEMCIVVDENDHIIDHKARELLQPEDIYRVAALWITDSHHQILLAQRKFSKKQDPGKWGPAVAGTVNSGQTYYDTIHREAQEELGLTDTYVAKGPKQRVKGEYNYFCQWYTLHTDKLAKDFVIQQEEVEQVRWISKKDVVKDMAKYPEHYLAQLNWPIENL